MKEKIACVEARQASTHYVDHSALLTGEQQISCRFVHFTHSTEQQGKNILKLTENGADATILYAMLRL
jgi:hypothetical protein